MKFVDFGFPEGKILGTFRTNCPGWKVKIKGAKCKVSWALRLVGGIHTYQLTADVEILHLCLRKPTGAGKEGGRVKKD